MKNFADKDEYAAWKRRCAQQRLIAIKNPCEEMEQATCTDYEVSCGPWNLRLCLERYVQPPVWHASVSYFKHVGEETIYDKATGLPLFAAPQDALLLVKDWTKEEVDVARSLLADLVGSLLADKDQRVIERQVFFALHWLLDEDDVNRRLAAKS